MKKVTISQVGDWVIVLLIFSLMVIIGNVIGYEGDLMASLRGMGWLLVITIVGLILKELIPVDLPDRKSTRLNSSH